MSSTPPPGREVPACHEWTPPAAPSCGAAAPAAASAAPAAVRSAGAGGALAAIRRWQAGRCAVCGLSPARLVIDHHHVSGLVRGLLCESCNVAEGRRTSSYAEPYASYRRRPPALIVGLTERYPHWRPNAYHYVLGDPPDDPALAARVLDHLIRHPPRRPTGRPVEIPGLPGHYLVGDEMRRLADRLAAEA
ncbi:endonuclease domain-containing protein [Streptomyces sp. WMMC500]|uniref:endonuclease domain-containing protein n=1 Tax=Streptomyces sp. WMMC500 TaxID=3015154 RepID=UPI00248B2EED|nr:endonuclease domain-containing protein [Streptomyces sp. WMMC500]WBB62107.1 endonuclease domain-containing protein [Streptomyces sp. WMMC500]